MAARGVGLAKGAMDLAVAYAKERVTFGKPIAKHQAIQMKLADMATRAEAARLLVEQAAQKYDSGERCDMEAGMAKLLEAGKLEMLVTQNIDTLHEMAGSRELVKVHGSADRVRCPRTGCRYGAPAGSLPPREADMEAFLAAPSSDTLPRPGGVEEAAVGQLAAVGAVLGVAVAGELELLQRLAVPAAAHQRPALLELDLRVQELGLDQEPLAVPAMETLSATGRSYSSL